MSKFSLALRSLVFVSVGGLISCVPDKPEKKNEDVKVTVVEDNFRIARPLIKKAGNESPAPATGEGAFMTPVSTEDTLVFPSLENHDFKKDKIRISTLSVCKGRFGEARAQAAIVDSKEILIRHLAPAEVLFKGEKSEQIVCRFEFEARNSRGSSHRFELVFTDLHSPDEELGLSLEEYDKAIGQGSARVSLTELQFGRVTVTPSRVPEERGEAKLLCEGFHSQTTFEGLRSVRLQDLTSNIQSYSAQPRQDQREKPAQNCRVVAVSEKEGVRKVIATGRFELLFGPSPIEITSDWVLDAHDVPPTDIGHFNVFDLRFRNPLSISVPIAIPKDKGMGLKLLPAVDPMGQRTFSPLLLPGEGPRINTGFYTGHYIPERIQIKEYRILLSLHGATEIPNDDYLIFVLNPGDSAIVRGRIRHLVKCVCHPGSSAICRGHEWFRGFYYDFDPLLMVVHQLKSNQLPQNGSFTPDFTRQVFVRPEERFGRPLRGWSPWLRYESGARVPGRDGSEPAPDRPSRIQPGGEQVACAW